MQMMLQPVARYLTSGHGRIKYPPVAGSFPNTSKTWLVIKKQFHSHAVSTFQDTAVNVTSDGRPHLWAIIGSIEYSDISVSNKVDG